MGVLAIPATAKPNSHARRESVLGTGFNEALKIQKLRRRSNGFKRQRAASPLTTYGEKFFTSKSSAPENARTRDMSLNSQLSGEQVTRPANCFVENVNILFDSETISYDSEKYWIALLFLDSPSKQSMRLAFYGWDLRHTWQALHGMPAPLIDPTIDERIFKTSGVWDVADDHVPPTNSVPLGGLETRD
jgi:hypothetical protein